MIRVVWSDEAKHDLFDIFAYIQQRSPDQARRVSEALVAAVARLDNFPESGRVVPEKADPGLREVIHLNYRIVYEYRSGDTAQILTVFRTERLFPGRASGGAV